MKYMVLKIQLIHRTTLNLYVILFKLRKSKKPLTVKNQLIANPANTSFTYAIITFNFKSYSFTKNPVYQYDTLQSHMSSKILLL